MSAKKDPKKLTEAERQERDADRRERLVTSQQGHKVLTLNLKEPDIFAAQRLNRESLDHCVKCTICETQCPVAAVTPLFSGPKYVGPQAERFRHGESVDHSLDYCSSCGI